jgi:hypothetical protein
MVTAKSSPSAPPEGPPEEGERARTGTQVASRRTGGSGEYAKVSVSTPPPSAASGGESPFRKPFASLPPTDAGITPSFTPPPSASGSLAPRPSGRPLVAKSPRKMATCQVHKIALSPSGECIVCRREAPRPVPWFILIGVLVAVMLSCILVWALV